jgi:carbonic anhydrase
VQATGLSNLGSITDPITEAVHMESQTKTGRTADNEAFVDRVAEINVRNTIRWIQANSPTLASMAMNGEIAIVGAMYDVRSGRVAFLDGVGFSADAPEADQVPNRASASPV